jgi:HSP20 family molecular chaperone IbpA
MSGNDMSGNETGVRENQAVLSANEAAMSGASRAMSGNEAAISKVGATQSERNSARDDRVLRPAVDVTESSEGVTLYADLPGVPKECLSVQVEGDTLVIEGEVRLDTPASMQATHVEIDVPRYRRAFTLSRDLDSSRVSAEYNHGVLKLQIPKAEHAQPRRIEVTVA